MRDIKIYFCRVLNACVHPEQHARTCGMHVGGGGEEEGPREGARTIRIERRDARVNHITSRVSRDVSTHIIKLCILKFRLFKYHTACCAGWVVAMNDDDDDDDDGDVEDDDVCRSTIGEFMSTGSGITGKR